MSNFFQSVVDDAEKVEEELLGPDYKYYEHIKTPEELGMSDAGTISALGKDINGIINYVELLVTGRGDANKSKGGRPLGDRFFLKTGGQCKDQATGKLVDRYMYIDNVPDGAIPFVSSGIGYKFTTFEGLIPGILSDIDKINPMDMFKAFSQDSEPACREITLETIGKDGNVGSETRFLPLDEIAVIEANDKKQKIIVKPTFKESDAFKPALTRAELKAQKEEEARKKKEEAAAKKKEEEAKKKEEAAKKKQEAEAAAQKKREEEQKKKAEAIQKKKDAEAARLAARKKREAFANYEGFTNNDEYEFVKDTTDNLDNAYLASVGMLYLYIFYRLIAKTTAM